MLGAKEKAVPNKVEAKERHILATITLATLKIIYLLLKAPLRSPLEAYTLIKDRTAASQITAEVQPLLQWLRGCLQYPYMVVNTLEAVELEDRMMSNRRRLLW